MAHTIKKKKKQTCDDSMVMTPLVQATGEEQECDDCYADGGHEDHEGFDDEDEDDDD